MPRKKSRDRTGSGTTKDPPSEPARKATPRARSDPEAFEKLLKLQECWAGKDEADSMGNAAFKKALEVKIQWWEGRATVSEFLMAVAERETKRRCPRGRSPEDLDIDSPDVAWRALVIWRRSAHKIENPRLVRSWLWGVVKNIVRKEIAKILRQSRPQRIRTLRPSRAELERVLPRLSGKHRDVARIHLQGVGDAEVRERLQLSAVALRQIWYRIRGIVAADKPR